MKTEIQISHIETGEVVKRIDVSGKSERMQEKCLMGVMRRLGDNYDAEIVEVNDD